SFEAGETIHTEISHKYSISEFAALASAAGFTVDRVWTDAKSWFSVQYLSVD
ncbi:MAG: L-histidine N(alpha)-methyltransferase, partial [Planctomycetota bacterium]|nr:L-histidine N(alpha)-methyltransferase [Planctomycetota bacterium]